MGLEERVESEMKAGILQWAPGMWGTVSLLVHTYWGSYPAFPTLLWPAGDWKWPLSTPLKLLHCVMYMYLLVSKGVCLRLNQPQDCAIPSLASVEDSWKLSSEHLPSFSPSSKISLQSRLDVNFPLLWGFWLWCAASQDDWHSLLVTGSVTASFPSSCFKHSHLLLFNFAFQPFLVSFIRVS